MIKDYGQNIPIVYESYHYDISKMGEGLPLTTYMLLGAISIIYQSSNDLTVTLYWQPAGKNSEIQSISYTASWQDNRFHQVLPIGIVCNKWYLKITGEITSICEISSKSVKWQPFPVGRRGTG